MPVASAAREASSTATPALRRVRREAAGGSVEPSRTAAMGGTRVALRAGRTLASTVTEVPTIIETVTVRVAITVLASGRSTPSALIRAIMPLAMPMPATNPAADASEADDEALEDHRALDLLARGAERPQRGELAGPLRDGDRQRVEDDERAHEQRDAAEAQQDQADGLHAVVDVLGAVLGRGLGVLDLECAADERLDRVHELADEVPSFAATEITS